MYRVSSKIWPVFKSLVWEEFLTFFLDIAALHLIWNNQDLKENWVKIKTHEMLGLKNRPFEAKMTRTSLISAKLLYHHG